MKSFTVIKKMLRLELENNVKDSLGGKKIFTDVLKNAEKILSRLPGFKNRLGGVVTLTLTGDREIHSLNKEYRGVDKPTDVLSFSYFDGKKFPGDDVVGEIVISLPTAKKQAKDHGKTLKQELQFLFLHGLLHVFGFDHIKKKERAAMFDLQDKIIGDKSWRKIAEAEALEEY